jgi:hypothetical protein
MTHRDTSTRARIAEHRDASERGDIDTEHAIYAADAIRGGDDLWISECVIAYDGAPTYSVSIMEFTDGLVTHETQYFADPFPAAASRAALAEHIPGSDR